MKWITEIKLTNYRAFGNVESIKIPKGNHLLVYGENGSGKSSIYNALKDFFSSAIPATTTKFKLNKFLDAAGNKAGSVSVSISEIGNENPPTELFFNSPPTASTHSNNPEIILANKFKGFLDYKRMLKVHSLDIPDDKTPNIFELLVEQLLCEHRVADPKGGVTTVEFFKEYKQIKTTLTTLKHQHKLKTKGELSDRFSEIEKELGDMDVGSEDIDAQPSLFAARMEYEDEQAKINDAIKILNAKEQLENLDTSLKTLLGQVIIIVNKFLKDHFKNKLVLDINYTKLEYNEKSNSMNENLSLKIKYAGTEIEFYQVFLNEARLSSLAICLYLASIKTFNPEAEALKILYLDDVFIGLDTSNRFPLLEIVKKEFIDDGFQVFISTYDREWFELSRHWFQTKVGKGKIKSLELFIDDDGNPNTPDYPVVMPYDGNLAKAKALFKSKDYPAAGNYLRKECEAIIKTLLPHTYMLTNDGSLIDDLEGLLNQLDKFYDECNIPKPTELTDSIKIYRKALLNPSSHNDSKSPLFKKEIQDALTIVDRLTALKKISRTQVAFVGDKYTYANTGSNYTVELELATNIWKVEHDGTKTLSRSKFRITKWTWGGTDYKRNVAGEVMTGADLTEFCLQERTLDKVFDIINHSTGIAKPQNPNTEIKATGGRTLNDLLQ